jgi:hypothetical protein
MGMRIPYWTQQIKVKAALDNRTATVGFNMPRDTHVPTRPTRRLCVH